MCEKYSAYTVWLGDLAKAQEAVVYANKMYNKTFPMPKTQEEAIVLSETRDFLQFLIDDGELTLTKCRESDIKRKADGVANSSSGACKDFNLFMEGLTERHLTALNILKAEFAIRFPV